MKFIIVSGIAFFVLMVFAIVFLPFLFGAGGEMISASGKGGGLFFSEDGGNSWKTLDGIIGKRAGVASLVVSQFVIDPGDATHLYLGTKGAGLWRSSDRGVYWEAIQDALGTLDPHAEIYRLLISKTNPRTWFVAVYQKRRGSLLKSEDGGVTFREVYFVPLERFGVFDVWQDETSGNVYLATGQGGFFESKDGGVSWRIAQWFPEGILRIIPHPRIPGTLYVLDRRGGLFSTKNFGENWLNISRVLSSFDGADRNQNLAIDPRAGVLYLGSNYGLIRSSDGGLSWKQVPIIIPPEALPVLSITFHPTEPQTFFISAHSLIYKTSDGGASWSNIASPVESKERVTAVLFDPHDALRMYAVKNQ